MRSGWQRAKKGSRRFEKKKRTKPNKKTGPVLHGIATHVCIELCACLLFHLIADVHMSSEILAKMRTVFQLIVLYVSFNFAFSVDTKYTWETVGQNVQCDIGAGEVYRASQSGKRSNVEECKKSCQNDAACNSITFFDDNWCSHFSSQCTKAKWISKAITLRVIKHPDSSRHGNYS